MEHYANEILTITTIQTDSQRLFSTKLLHHLVKWSKNMRRIIYAARWRKNASVRLFTFQISNTGSGCRHM